MPFEFRDEGPKDVRVIKPEIFEDERGYLVETYLKRKFQSNGINEDFIQDKFSRSEGGVLRGLHYQKGEYAQSKIVECVEGRVIDVAVDLRRSSATFGEYLKTEISEENRKMVYVPKGFAHGFLVVSDTAQIHYKIDSSYAPNQEAGIIWNDSELDIDWPTDGPKLSDKDKELPTLEEAIEKEVIF